VVKRQEGSAFAGNIWEFDLTNELGFFRKKQDLIECSLSGCRAVQALLVLKGSGGNDWNFHFGLLSSKHAVSLQQ
jgi:hypothetical protein